jgi:glycosyltransferase
MRISIITVVYNNAKTLAGAIESVLSQSYNNIEYIIVDGNSNDGTTDIIHKYENRLSYWVSEPDKGMYDALNKGILKASGDIIGILHSDDLFDHPSVVSEIASVFDSTHCDAVYGDLVYVSRDDPSKIIRYWKSKPFMTKLLRKGWMPPHPTLFIRKEWYDQLKGFDISFPVAADYELMIRFLSSGKLKCEYLPQIITRMRVGGKSNKNIKNIVLKSYDDYRTIHRYKVGGLWTLFRKNFSKLNQFLYR